MQNYSRMTGTLMMEFWLEQYFQSQKHWILKKTWNQISAYMYMSTYRNVSSLVKTNQVSFYNTILKIPHYENLGASVGDIEFDNRFVAKKHSAARALLSSLEEIGSIDPHVAFTLLQLCAGFCKLSHLARITPPSLASNALQEFDFDIHLFFSKCTGVDTPDHAWHQAHLSLRMGGLGLRSLARHSPAAYIAYLSNSNCATSTYCQLAYAIAQYNTFVLPSDALSANDFVDHMVSQRQLSDRLEDVQSLMLPPVLINHGYSSHHHHMHLPG